MEIAKEIQNLLDWKLKSDTIFVNFEFENGTFEISFSFSLDNYTETFIYIFDYEKKELKIKVFVYDEYTTEEKLDEEIYKSTKEIFYEFIKKSSENFTEVQHCQFIRKVYDETIFDYLYLFEYNEIQINTDVKKLCLLEIGDMKCQRIYLTSENYYQNLRVLQIPQNFYGKPIDILVLNKANDMKNLLFVLKNFDYVWFDLVSGVCIKKFYFCFDVEETPMVLEYSHSSLFNLKQKDEFLIKNGTREQIYLILKNCY